jgi:hypothetical protein
MNAMFDLRELATEAIPADGETRVRPLLARPIVDVSGAEPFVPEAGCCGCGRCGKEAGMGETDGAMC